MDFPFQSPFAVQEKTLIKSGFFRRLALLNDFRTFDWAEEYKYPTVVLDQMKGLLAKYETLYPLIPQLCALVASFVPRERALHKLIP